MELDLLLELCKPVALLAVLCWIGHVATEDGWGEDPLEQRRRRERKERKERERAGQRALPRARVHRLGR